MTSRKPSEPSPSDFMETAAKSREAGIADETAAYDQQPAIGRPETNEGGDASEESSAHPS